MAGAMYEALERLRTFHATLSAAKKIVELDIGFWIHHSTAQAMLDEVAAAANILKTGLKSRFVKE